MHNLFMILPIWLSTIIDIFREASYAQNKFRTTNQSNLSNFSSEKLPKENGINFNSLQSSNAFRVTWIWIATGHTWRSALRNLIQLAQDVYFGFFCKNFRQQWPIFFKKVFLNKKRFLLYFWLNEISLPSSFLYVENGEKNTCLWKMQRFFQILLFFGSEKNLTAVNFGYGQRQAWPRDLKKTGPSGRKGTNNSVPESENEGDVDRKKMFFRCSC